MCPDRRICETSIQARNINPERLFSQNLDIEGDNITVSLCVVEGNVHIKGANNIMVDCEVWGDIKAEGNDHALVSNFAAKNWDTREGYVCTDNQAVDDANENGRIDEGEITVDLVCPQKYP